MTADGRSSGSDLGGDRPVLLVYRTLGLGDLLTAVPALRALADAFRSHRRILVTSGWTAPLVSWIPGRFEASPAESLAPVQADVVPDVAVNLHGRGPQSHRIVLATRPDRMIAFGNGDVPFDGPAWSGEEHEVARWCRLLRESGIAADTARLEISAPEPFRPARCGAVIVHPGAADRARQWPPGRWADVARWERLRGHRVVVTGSAAERGAAAEIGRVAGLPMRDVLAGRLDLRGLAGLVASGRKVLSGDTGVAHLAFAVGTPSVTLFGPTSPATWGPPADRAIHRVIWHGTTDDPHAGEPAEGLLSIEPHEVIAESLALEASPAPDRSMATALRR
jgi:ADP-heptose:LPS heptosyltransferase